MIQLPFPLSFVGGQIKNTKTVRILDIGKPAPYETHFTQDGAEQRELFVLSQLLTSTNEVVETAFLLNTQLLMLTWCCELWQQWIPASSFLTFGTLVSNSNFLGAEALSAVSKLATTILKLGSHLQWFVELLSLWSGSVVDHPGISAYPCMPFNNVNSV